MIETIALVREVSASIGDCELTHLDRSPIQLDRARAQHAAVVSALEAAGARIVRLPRLDDLPDAVFVEDAAVVLDEVAILTRPGAARRRPEVASVAAALRDYRPCEALGEDATLDGGDVVVDGKRIYVGQTSRTNRAGYEQLKRLAQRYGYTVTPVPVRGCLHLKTAVTTIGDGAFVGNPQWYDPSLMPGAHIAVAADEPFAGNACRVNDVLIHAEAHPATAARLRKAGFELIRAPADELARAEGAITCCSVLVRVAA